jgi:hypothetical protein
MGLIGLGDSLVATALPAMPVDVTTANNIVSTQPYWNLIIQIAQQPASNASSDNTVTAAQIAAGIPQAAAQYKSLSGPQQQALLAPYLALWSFLPTYLASAPVVDAYNKQMGSSYTPETNPYAFIYYTEYGQAAQSFLTQFFQAIGVTPPTLNNSGTGSGNVPPTLIFGIAALVLLWLVMK